MPVDHPQLREPLFSVLATCGLREGSAEHTASERLVAVLHAYPNSGLLMGGSATAGLPDPGDLDFWLVVDDPLIAKTTIASRVGALPSLNYVHDAGFFPWLGELITICFFPDARLCIDVGLCSPRMLADANPGPNPIVLWGDAQLLRSFLRQQLYKDLPTNRLGRLFVNLLKVRKNVGRGHLWDAVECLAKARREVMALRVDTLQPCGIRYSRAERRIEDTLSTEELSQMADTYPALTRQAILAAAVRVCEIAEAMAASSCPNGTWSCRLSELRQSMD